MNIAFENSNEQLFDHSEENSWDMHIAFEEELIPDEVSSQDFAMLDQRELNDLYKRYDLKQAATKIEDEQLEETLAEVEQEEDLLEELAVLDVEEEDVPSIEDEQPQELAALEVEEEDVPSIEDEQLEETLAEVEQEEDLLEELAVLDVEEEDVPPIEDEQPQELAALEVEDDQPEEEIIPGYFVAEDYIVLPVNSRGCTGYQTTYLPTGPEPLAYVKVPAYFIDESPVTNNEYAKFVQETGYPAPKNWEGIDAPQGLENEPVSFVSYDDATAYAAWLGRRLPTEIEWSIALENGLIQTDDSHPEWTSTPAADNKKVVILEKGTLEISPNHIDRGMTFRTLQPK